MSKRVAIGIDLGTTYSCVGVFREGRVDIIENNMGRRITPSWVAFDEDGILIGEAAKRQVLVNPRNTVFETKRLIGRKFEDPVVQNDIKQWPFEVLNDNDSPKIRVNYKNRATILTPEEISARMLSEMKNIAEKRVGHEVLDAVITVPAYFNDSQRQATIDAGNIAGLNVLSIINEPTAAAIAYGVDKESSLNQNILVFDFGGGTLDVAVLSIVEKYFQVKAVGGDTHLGGSDMDSKLVDHFLEVIMRKYNKVIDNDCRVLGRLRSSCETAKIALSAVEKTKISIDCLFDGIDFQEYLTRVRLEDLCDDLFTETIEHVRKVLSDANLSKSDIDEVVLVGGSSRIPKVRELLKSFFGIKKLNETINPDEAVAYGATMRAFQMLSADETAQKITLQDVIPFSLGMEGTGDDMRIFIPRNSLIPTTVKQENWSTGRDYQDSVSVRVYEGESLQASKNNLLGRFELHHGEHEKKGVPQLAFTFTVDANGILHVSGENSRTNCKKEITITSKKGRLSKEDIKKMKEGARTSSSEASDHELEASDVLATQDPKFVMKTNKTPVRSKGYPPLHSKGKRSLKGDSIWEQKVRSYCSKQQELLLAEGPDSPLKPEERDAVQRACEEALLWLDGEDYQEEVCESKLQETEIKCTLIMRKLRRKTSGN